VEAAAARDVGVVWATPDHPWVDEAGSADVRVAMTVLAKSPAKVVLVRVDHVGPQLFSTSAERLNSDLTIHADVASAAKHQLRANVSVR